MYSSNIRILQVNWNKKSMMPKLIITLLLSLLLSSCTSAILTSSALIVTGVILGKNLNN